MQKTIQIAHPWYLGLSHILAKDQRLTEFIWKISYNNPINGVDILQVSIQNMKTTKRAALNKEWRPEI